MVHFGALSALSHLPIQSLNLNTCLLPCSPQHRIFTEQLSLSNPKAIVIFEIVMIVVHLVRKFPTLFYPKPLLPSSFYWASVANAPKVLQPYWLIVLPLDVPDLTASLLL